MFVWPLGLFSFYVSLYLGLLAYQLEMLYNVYSTPEALHDSRLTQKQLSGVVFFKFLFKATFIDTIGPLTLKNRFKISN